MHCFSHPFLVLVEYLLNTAKHKEQLNLRIWDSLNKLLGRRWPDHGAIRSMKRWGKWETLVFCNKILWHSFLKKFWTLWIKPKNHSDSKGNSLNVPAKFPDSQSSSCRAISLSPGPLINYSADAVSSITVLVKPVHISSIRSVFFFYVQKKHP